MFVSVFVDRDVDHAQIDAKEVCCRGLGFFGNIDRHQQEPFPVFPEDEVTLAFRPAESLSLILSHNVGNDHAAFEGRNAHAIRALEADVLAHAVRDRSMFAELGAFVLVPLVRFDT